mmetsp:Transcript_96863/g.178059  ORF Transcript_96863/g.178059 Transcript_96863/m.178059 type:complete len:989 (-) Transcript_96863:482-3448(-)
MIAMLFEKMCSWSFENVWPPTEKSQQVLTAFLVVEMALLCMLFRQRESSKHAKKVLKTRLARLREGRKLLIEDVQKIDKEPKSKKNQEWEGGLPEASRILGYLWDSLYEQPTTSLGLEANDDHLLVKQLFNRALHSELTKAQVFTRQARTLETQQILCHGSCHQPSPCGAQSPTPEQTKLLNARDEWLQKHDTTAQEVAEYLSGEKLQEVLDMAENAEKNLGRHLLAAETKTLVKQGKALCKNAQFRRHCAIQIIVGIACRLAPMWILSNVFFAIQIMGWTEFDRVLFSGEIGLTPLGEDGTYDSALGAQLAWNCVMNCVVWWLSDLVAHVLIQKTTSQATLLLKKRLVECLFFQDYEYFETHNVGKLQALVNQDAQEVSENLFILPKDLISALIMIGIKLYACFQLAPSRLVLQCLAPIPVVAFINRKMMERGRREEKKSNKIAEEVSANTNDVISNIRTMRTFATEAEEVSRFQGCVEKQSSLAELAQLMQAASIRFFIFCITASIAWTTYLAGESVAAGKIRTADLMVFSVNMLHQVHLWQNFFSILPRFTKMMRPFARVINLMMSESKIEPNPNLSRTGVVQLLIKSKTELAEILHKLETADTDSRSERFTTFVRVKAEFTANGHLFRMGMRLTSIVPVWGAESEAVPTVEYLQDLSCFPLTLIFNSQHMPSKLIGKIKFDDVKFHYPTDLRKQVLKGMTFEIRPGQKVGICGSAGCGKSTTMDLLQRLYDVDSDGGAIYLDGVDIRSYNVHFLRQRIGVVAQKTVLFKTTVRENIWYGMQSNPGDAAVEEALRQAQAWEFIQEKPDKLLTILTETGGGFSGGQMQRLAIARCLIRKPDVILLDEATAALDPVNERLVQDTLDKVTNGRFTTLAIAHRLTTIKDADKIIVLDKGRVVEEGSHDKLMAKIKTYNLDDEGNKVMSSGFYRHQWETQFNESVSEFKSGTPAIAENLNAEDDYAQLIQMLNIPPVPPILKLKKAQTSG